MSVNRNLPADSAVVVRRVRDHLRAQVDLADCTIGQLADAMGAPYSTIQHRLRSQGTTWEAEKRTEKTRRLKILLDKPGKLNISRAAQFCGFVEHGSFFRFFKEVMGQTFTEYRMGVTECF